MVEELKLAIKIDDASIEQSLLKQFANAQKMADKVVLDFKNVNFDDKQIEAKFKEMQKKAGQNPINLTISDNALDMLGQIDKRLTEIFSIEKGKSFIDSSSITADIDKIENKINELNKKYEEAQKKSSSIGSGNVFGKDVNLIDNVDFQKLIQEVSELKNQFDDLKTHMQLLDDYTVPTDRFFELQSQVEGTTARVSDLVKEISRLSSEVGATDGFAWELEDLKKKVNEVFEEINKSKKNLNDKNDVVDKNSLETIINLFSKMESSLSSIKGVLVDVGDGEELSPLLSEINNIQTAIGGLSSSLNNLHFNMNIDMGTDNQMDAKIQEKAAKALNAYEKLFNGLKMSGYGGEVVNNKFFDFDINKFDTTIGKVKAYKDIIERLRKEAKEYYSGTDLLRTQTDDKLWRSASSAGGQLTQAINETAKSKADNPLTELFGKTDLSGVIEQLNTIVSKLDEISVSAKGFTETFKNGLNVNASVEEIEKLTNRVKELESELAKIKPATAVTTDQTKDAFPSTDTKLDEAVTSAKDLNKTLNQIDIPTDSFDKVLEKLDKTKSELVDIVKITKQSVSDADEKFHDSYTLKDSRGSTEIYGMNSKTDKGQILRRNIVGYDAKKDTELIQKNKTAYEELTEAIRQYSEVSKRVSSGKAKDDDIEKMSQLEEKISQLQKQPILSDSQVAKSESALVSLYDQLDKIERKLQETNQKQVGSGFGKLFTYQSKIDKYNTTINRFKDGGWTSNTYLENVQAVKNAVKKYETLLNELKGKDASLVTSDDINKLDNYEKKIKDTIATVTNMSASEKGYNFVSGQKELDKIHKLLNENSKMSSEAKAKIKAYYAEIESGNPSMSLDKIHGEILKIYNAEVEAGRAGRTLFDTLKNSGFHQIAAQMAGMFGVYDVINLGKEGLSIVRELNTALTEMRKVSDESLQSLKNYQNTTFDTADAVGTTAKQIQTSTADYMRLGESLDKAAESAKTANVLLNVSEFDNIEDATKSLVAMGQAYKDLDKMTIVDKLNEVGNNYAISTDELATALQKSAATLSLMGNTIDESASLVTTANATIQDADSVSAGLRTISLRLVGTEEAEEELSAMNEEVDAFVKATNSKKQQIIKDYTAVASNNYQGFDILDNNGNYKNTYEILLGIAKVYKEIQEQDKKLGTNHATALIEELAGKNRSNIASAILQDPTQLEAVKKSSEEAMGSAEKELNSYLDSIDGKMAQLENRAQEFWFKVVDSEAIKNGIDLLSTLLKGATDFVDTVGLLPTILTGIGAGLSFKNIGKCYVSA